MVSRSRGLTAGSFRKFAPLSIALFGLSGVFLAGCDGAKTAATAPVTRPRLAPAYHGQWDSQKVLEASKGVAPRDPDLCPAAANPDTDAAPIGALSTRTIGKFATQPNTQNLYSRLILTMKVCTDSTLSSADRKAFTAILDFLKITKARSFAATVSITGGGSGGIAVPQMVPFSYKFDESTSTYSVQTLGQGLTPWQVTSSYQVNYAYSASTAVSIDTASLFSSIATSISGAGSSTALLSPAANAYLAASNIVLQQVAGTFKGINDGKDEYQMEVVTAQDRGLTYRFKDLSNPPKPLAAVRLSVVFTNSVQNPVPLDPTASGSTVPKFTELQDILGVYPGGQLMGTLGQAISKEASYQNLLKSTADTSPASFASDCNTLEGALKSTYGLNVYDAALAMGEILSQNTLYLSSKKFYTSGCFKNRDKLKAMGINDFETAPTT